METTRRVNDLKAALAKQLGHEEGDSDLERCIELLTELDQCSITLNILSKTLVGAVVTKFRRYRDDDISKKAKLLIKKWKKLAKVGQVESKLASASASSSASSAPRSSLAQVSTTAPGSNAADSSEWDHLPQLRRNIASKLNQTLLLSSKNLKLGKQTSALSSLCTSLATEIEVEMDILNKGDKATYTNKVRSLIFNLKKNSSLCENILLVSWHNFFLSWTISHLHFCDVFRCHCPHKRIIKFCFEKTLSRKILNLNLCYNAILMWHTISIILSTLKPIIKDQYKSISLHYLLTQ